VQPRQSERARPRARRKFQRPMIFRTCFLGSERSKMSDSSVIALGRYSQTILEQLDRAIGAVCAHRRGGVCRVHFHRLRVSRRVTARPSAALSLRRLNGVWAADRRRHRHQFVPMLQRLLLLLRRHVRRKLLGSCRLPPALRVRLRRCGLLSGPAPTSRRSDDGPSVRSRGIPPIISPALRRRLSSGDRGTPLLMALGQTRCRGGERHGSGQGVGGVTAATVQREAGQRGEAGEAQRIGDHHWRVHEPQRVRCLQHRQQTALRVLQCLPQSMVQSASHDARGADIACLSGLMLQGLNCDRQWPKLEPVSVTETVARDAMLSDWMCIACRIAYMCRSTCVRHWEGDKESLTGMLMAPRGGCCTAIADNDAIAAGSGSFRVPAAAAADAVATARRKPPISGAGRGGCGAVPAGPGGACSSVGAGFQCSQECTCVCPSMMLS